MALRGTVFSAIRDLLSIFARLGPKSRPPSPVFRLLGSHIYAKVHQNGRSFTPLAFSSAEKSITVHTNKQTQADKLSIPTILPYGGIKNGVIWSLNSKLQITPFSSHYTLVYNCNEIREVSFGDRLLFVGQTVGLDCVVIWGTSMNTFITP